MAQDINQDFAAGPSVSGLFSSNITAGSSQLSSTFDLGSPTPGGFNIELKPVTGTGTPDGNQRVVVRCAWSDDNTDFDDSTNEEVVGYVNVGAASTTFTKIIRVFAKARYCKIRITNDQSAGPDITTSSTIALTDVSIDQV